ncbi:lysophospholipid acyltransferase family protein [Melioribacter sp. OK-6-Me]|uniref:lysophospholipid acyltransferase family protein n=1 Tax=unclassified Melioribacter TaxID=2627329 RepID=UPI003ED94C3C
MLKSKHHFFIYPMFKVLTRILIKMNFKDVFIQGDYINSGKSLLILANHVSWWDGFFIMYLNQKLLKRKFHFMMLEEQLKKHWYFQYSGGFSVKKKSRSVLETIDYAAKLLSCNENMVLLFPQGEINSIYNTNIKFERGVEYILKKCPDNVNILFVVNLIDYFSNRKPSLYMFIKTCKITYKDVSILESEYNKFYTEAIYKHITQK